MANRDVELERLTPAQRVVARRLRRAAAIVAAAGLPARYRPAAFARVVELELDGDDDDAGDNTGDVVPLAA
jgi:hypothetical protein